MGQISRRAIHLSLQALTVVLFLISTNASAITVSVSSGDGETSSSMSTTYDTTVGDFVHHEIMLDGGSISNHQYGTGGFTKTVTSTDSAGNRAQSYEKVVASGLGMPTTQYWSQICTLPGAQTQARLTARNAKSITAWSLAYSPDGNNVAQSSVSINPSLSSPTILASLDYFSRAYADGNGFHSEQQAYSGRSIEGDSQLPDSSYDPLVPILPKGASGDKVTFTEVSYDGSGHYATSSLDATNADVDYYSGRAE